MTFSYNRGFGYQATELFRQKLERAERTKPKGTTYEWIAETSRALTDYCKEIRGQGTRDDALLTWWEVLTHDALSSFKPIGLSANFYSFAKAGYLPHEQWYQPWLDASYRQMSGFNEQALGNMFYGHALLGRTPDAAWYQRWADASRGRMEGFNDQGLSTIFYGHALLGKMPAAAWYQRWADVSRKRMEGFNEQGLGNMLYGHALLGKVPDAAWYKRWEEVTLRQMNGLGEQALSNIFYALAVCKTEGMQVDGMAQRIWQEIQKCPPSQMSGIRHFQHYQALRVFDWKVPPETRKGVLSAKMDVATSSMEKRVMQVLRDIQQDGWALGEDISIRRLDSEVKHPITLSPVDFTITLEVKGRARPITLYMELDGASHFVQQPDGRSTRNGSTLIRDHLQSLPQEGKDTCRITLAHMVEQSLYRDVADAIVQAVAPMRKAAKEEPQILVSQIDRTGRVEKALPAQATAINAPKKADKTSMAGKIAMLHEGRDKDIKQR